MRTSRLRTAAVVLMTLLMAAPQAAASSAGTASGDDSRWLDEYGANHLVVAGAREPGWPTNEPGRFDYLAYYPTNLQIHRGDVVYFATLGHTVTFTPQHKPRTGYWRRDEIEPVLQIDNILPSDPTCGTSAEAPACVFDSPDQFVNSGWNYGFGIIRNDLKLAVDLPEGVYTYYCTIHAGMEGTIEVVPDDEPVPTPTEVDATRQAEIASDTEEAIALLNDPPAMPPPEPIGDNRRWFVQVGAVTPSQRVDILQFFPGSLPIEPGDEVEFFAPDTGVLPGRVESTFAFHTATFEPNLLRTALADGSLYYLDSMCDPDDPTSGLPGVPLLVAAAFVGCPDGSTFEVAVHPWAVQDPLRAPDDIVTPEGFHDSGWLAPADGDCRLACDPYSDERLPSTSRAVFPVDGVYAYRCLLHRGMEAAIEVGD